MKIIRQDLRIQYGKTGKGKKGSKGFNSCILLFTYPLLTTPFGSIFSVFTKTENENQDHKGRNL
jgi:hypothetical protein